MCKKILFFVLKNCIVGVKCYFSTIDKNIVVILFQKTFEHDNNYNNICLLCVLIQAYIVIIVILSI